MSVLFLIFLSNSSFLIIEKDIKFFIISRYWGEFHLFLDLFLFISLSKFKPFITHTLSIIFISPTYNFIIRQRFIPPNSPIILFTLIITSFKHHHILIIIHPEYEMPLGLVLCQEIPLRFLRLLNHLHILNLTCYMKVLTR